METRRLSLVREGSAGTALGPGDLRVLSSGAVLLLIALACSLLGADDARRRLPSRELAESALARSLESGSADEEVQDTLRKLRRSLATHPLDTRTRVVYSGLLLGLSRQIEDMPAAAFHAQLAAELSPVTVPVVRAASIVLARTGRRDLTVEWVRRMFDHAPESAAEVLMQLEIMLFEPELQRAIADSPIAWVAWSRQLDRAGREEESWLLLREGFERWPDDFPLQRRLASQATLRDDAGVLDKLFLARDEIPALPQSAALLTYRARWRAGRGERRGALDDVASALDAAPDDPAVRILAGDAYEQIGEIASARRCWNAALHALPAGAGETRRRLLLSLARLEDRYGQPAAALRLWRSLLELDPDNTAARRRIEELSGFTP